MVTFSILKNTDDAALKDLAYALLTVGAIGLVILIYNILPMRIDSMTDGYRLTMVSNPKKAGKGFSNSISNKVSFAAFKPFTFLIIQAPGEAVRESLIREKLNSKS